MLIKPINTKYNYITFNAGKIPGSASHIVDSELRNKSVMIDIKLKEFMQNLVDKNISMTRSQIVSKLGITPDIFRYRVQKNEELELLWEIIKSLTRQKSVDINNKIKSVLEKLLELNIPASLEYIGKQAGLNRAACFKRIKENSELKVLWDKAERVPTTTKSPESLKIDAKIKEFLENAIINNLIVRKADIADALGLRVKQVEGRLIKDAVLYGLWKKLEHRNYQVNEKSKEKNLEIKKFIEQAINENRNISIKEISEYTGLTKPSCRKRIVRNSDIKALWDKVNKNKQSKRERYILGEKRNALINQIREMLESAMNKGKYLTITEIAENCNITNPTTYNIINNNSDLKNIWIQIGHGEILKKESQDLNSRIEKFLKIAIENNLPVFIEDISNAVNASIRAVQHRMYLIPELKVLWKQTPRKKVHYISRTSINKTKEIQEVLKEKIQKNYPITLKELATETGYKYSGLQDKINRTPELFDRWVHVERKMVSEDSLILNENIKVILNDAIENNRFISMKEIAKRFGITYLSCVQRIKRYPELDNLWKLVQKLKIEKSQSLDNKIKEIIQNRIDSNNIIKHKDIIKESGISNSTIKNRIRKSNELKSLWEDAKDIDTQILKQFYELKKNNTGAQEIRKMINLTESKFAEISTKYEKIKANLLNLYGYEIPEEDILNWAFLSKREFELGINELFSKMGYKSKTTRFSIDNGIDIVAEKEGKTTFIECMHNLYRSTIAEEVMMLQGNKYYYNADNVIYVATSGATVYGQKFVEKMGDNFKLLTLKDVIKLAKKYNVDVNRLEEKGNVAVVPVRDYHGKWIFSQKSKKEDLEKFRKMTQTQFEKKISEFFVSMGYTVEKADELNLHGFYIVSKNNHKIVVKCQKENKTPTTDSIKALYGLKDFYNVDEVMLIGASSITSQSKEFIDTINRRKETKNTFKLMGLDKIIANNNC